MYILIVCYHCGQFLLAKTGQKTRRCSYCKARLILYKTRKVMQAETAQEASNKIRILKQTKAKKTPFPNQIIAAKRKTLRVDDVHSFPGHIACDAASQSEIVIPLIKNDKLIGVLDIDSPIKNRFTETDQVYLEKFSKLLCNHL